MRKEVNKNVDKTSYFDLEEFCIHNASSSSKTVEYL